MPKQGADGEELNSEMENGVSRDLAKHSVRTVAEMWADACLARATDLHALDGVLKPWEDGSLAHDKGSALVGLHDVTVVQRQRVQDFDLTAPARDLPRADEDVLVTETTPTPRHQAAPKI